MSEADRARRVEDGAPDKAEAIGWIGAQFADPSSQVGAVLVGLTRFEVVNAAYGRAMGDRLLDAAERRVRVLAAALGTAAVWRLGGSEFLLVARTGQEEIARAAEAAARSIGRRFVIGGASVALGSRTVSVMREAADNPDSLIGRARETLARAKALDATGPLAAQPTGVAPLFNLAADLHRAIERGEIGVLFQPQVSLATGAIVGAEALARWEHPRLGPLGADLLFAAAERADLGLALSAHVQELALTRAAAWPASLARLRLSVNITAADIAQPTFDEEFLTLVKTTGFPPERLTAELTETALVVDLDHATASLGALRAAGCRVAIDDFGTGYSSLAYLKALPVDYLKIDRALTQDIAGSERDRVVVRGVVAIARALGMTVIAEGVETPGQRDLLAAEGCELFQGFLCAEALSTDALAELVDR